MKEQQLPDDTDMMSMMTLGDMRKVMDELLDALNDVPEPTRNKVGWIVKKHLEKDYMPVSFMTTMLGAKSKRKTKQ